MMTRAFGIRVAALASLSLGFGSTASADFVPGVTTTTTMGTLNSGYDIPDLTNGKGLSTLDATATHSVTFSDMWMSALNQTTGSLTFDLGGLTTIDSIVVWNYNYIPGTTTSNRAVNQFDIFTSTDGLSFTLLTNASLAKPTGGDIAATIFNVASVPSRFVRFDILSNYGDVKFTGLSEVQFDGSPCAPTVYGAGCVGSGGFTPKLSSNCPEAGNTLSVSITEGLGGSSALILLGASQASLPMTQDCKLLVSPLFPVMITIPLSGAGPGAGAATLVAGLPLNSAGVQFTMQVFVPDVGVPVGFSNSNGLDLQIQ